MITLEPVPEPESFGIRLETDEEPFKYFEFHVAGKPPIFYAFGPWHFVGVRVNTANTSLEMRLLQVEEDDLEEEHISQFNAVRDTGGYISISPDRLLALITFLESQPPLIAGTGANSSSSLVKLALDDLVSLGLTRNLHPNWLQETDYYRCELVESAESYVVSLIALSNWSSPFRESALMSVKFMTFSRRELANPDFNPMLADGIGIMRFDRATLRRFVQLLQEHVFR